MPSPDEHAEALARRINSLSLSDENIKTAVVAEALAEMDEEEVVEVFRIIIEKGALKQPKFLSLFKTFGNLGEIMRRIGSRKMSGVYAKSREKGYDDVTRMIKDIPARRNADDVPGDVYVDPKLKDVSLGMKKSLGRLGNQDLVNRLLHDQDPAVIEQILNNPGLTEDQVIKIAAKRPTSARVLKGISQNVKWMARYTVKKSLVFNPYTPTEISIRLAGVLLRQDQIEVSKDTSLHAELRLAAKNLVAAAKLKDKPLEIKTKDEEKDEGPSSS